MNSKEYETSQKLKIAAFIGIETQEHFGREANLSITQPSNTLQDSNYGFKFKIILSFDNIHQ